MSHGIDDSVDSIRAVVMETAVRLLGRRPQEGSTRGKEPVSGTEIAAELGLARSAVFEALTSLGEEHWLGVQAVSGGLDLDVRAVDD